MPNGNTKTTAKPVAKTVAKTVAKPVDGDKRKAAQKLMEASERKKKAAAQQETLGKAQIKNKVKEGSMGSIAPYTKKMGDVGKPIPVGQQRLDIAKKLRQEASQDSLKAVKMYPQIAPKKRK